jgi:hypothetical protein
VADLVRESGGRPLRAFNLALPGAPLDLTLIVARDVLHGRRQPKILVLGIMPRAFLEHRGEQESDLLFRYGNLSDITAAVQRGELSITDLAAAPFRGVENLLQATFQRLKKPIHAYRHDHLQKGMGGWWAPADSADAPIVPHDIWRTMLSKAGDAHPLCLRDDSRPADLLRAFRDLAQERSIQLILVQPPQHPDFHKRLFVPGDEESYQTWINGFCRREGITFWEMSGPEGYEHGDFADPVHLNARGADKFSRRLAERLSGGTVFANRPDGLSIRPR